MFFGVHGVALGAILEPGMSLGGYFEGLGVVLGESSAQFLLKTPGSILFERFLRQHGSQKDTKMELIC